MIAWYAISLARLGGEYGLNHKDFPQGSRGLPRGLGLLEGPSRTYRMLCARATCPAHCSHFSTWPHSKFVQRLQYHFRWWRWIPDNTFAKNADCGFLIHVWPKNPRQLTRPPLTIECKKKAIRSISRNDFNGQNSFFYVFFTSLRKLKNFYSLCIVKRIAKWWDCWEKEQDKSHTHMRSRPKLSQNCIN